MSESEHFSTIIALSEIDDLSEADARKKFFAYRTEKIVESGLFDDDKWILSDERNRCGFDFSICAQHRLHANRRKIPPVCRCHATGPKNAAPDRTPCPGPRGSTWILLSAGSDAGADLVELPLDLLGGRRRHQTGHHDAQAGDQEGGQQLVDVPHAAQGPDQQVPHEHHHAAADHAGDGPGPVDPLPEQAQQHQRPEGGAEARPGEADDGEDHAVLVQGDDDGHRRDGQQRQPGDQQHLPVSGLPVEEALVDVLGEGGGRDQQIGVGGADGGRQDARHYKKVLEYPVIFIYRVRR